MVACSPPTRMLLLRTKKAHVTWVNQTQPTPVFYPILKQYFKARKGHILLRNELETWNQTDTYHGFHPLGEAPHCWKFCQRQFQVFYLHVISPTEHGNEMSGSIIIRKDLSTFFLLYFSSLLFFGHEEVPNRSDAELEPTWFCALLRPSRESNE